MHLFPVVFLICFLNTESHRSRPPNPSWRKTDTSEAISSFAPQTMAGNSSDVSEYLGRRQVEVTHCREPQPNISAKTKIGNGTLILNCTPPTPYCDFEKNVCVSTIPAHFNCEENGRYPHIADCRGYIICSNGESFDKACPLRSSYDYESKRCIEEPNKKCVIPNCTGRSGRYVRHPAGPGLFVLCLAGVPSKLYTCPQGYLYSGYSNAPCELDCVGIGFFANIYDRTMYYECSYNGKTMTRIVHYCPQGIFDNKYKACVPWIKIINNI